MKLFVYGSLKRGGWAHHIIEERIKDSKPAEVVGSLYKCGNFPALAIDSPHYVQNDMVKGILYDIVDKENGLIELDRLEGYPHLFERMIMPVFVYGERITIHDALVYYGNDSRLFEGDRIESGEWKV